MHRGKSRRYVRATGTTEQKPQTRRLAGGLRYTLLKPQRNVLDKLRSIQ